MTLQPIPLFAENNSISENTCSICLEDMNTVSSQEIHTLTECSHKFHNSCIIQWLRTGKSKCPVCRGVQDEKERRRFAWYIDRKNMLRLVLNYSKRKDAPKELVKMVKKYDKAREKQKVCKLELRTFNKAHKDIFKKRGKLHCESWKQTRKLRSLKNELTCIPIQPLRREK